MWGSAKLAASSRSGCAGIRGSTNRWGDVQAQNQRKDHPHDPPIAPIAHSEPPLPANNVGSFVSFADPEQEFRLCALVL